MGGTTNVMTNVMTNVRPTCDENVVSIETKSAPSKMATAAATRPCGVSGEMSPYPTVEKGTRTNQIAYDMLPTLIALWLHMSVARWLQEWRRWTCDRSHVVV